MNIKKLQIAYFIVWVIPIFLALLFSLGILGERTNTWEEGTKYGYLMLMDIITIVAIYLNVKLFNFKKIVQSFQKNPESASKKYGILNIVRYSIFTIIILAALYSYFATNSDSGLYVTLMILVAHIFCYPSEQEVNYIINKDKPQEEK